MRSVLEHIYLLLPYSGSIVRWYGCYERARQAELHYLEQRIESMQFDLARRKERIEASQEAVQVNKRLFEISTDVMNRTCLLIRAERLLAKYAEARRLGKQEDGAKLLRELEAIYNKRNPN